MICHSYSEYTHTTVGFSLKLGDPLRLMLSRPNDLAIAVMGLTGSGKSTFINLLVDQEVTIGHGLVSCKRLLRSC